MGDDEGRLPFEAAFARNLRTARERRGWSQTHLAKQLTARGVPFFQQQVARIESGERPVRLNEAVVLAELLGTSLDDLTAPPDHHNMRLWVIYAQMRLNTLTGALWHHLGVQLGEIAAAQQEMDEAWAAYERMAAAAGERPEPELANTVERMRAIATGVRENGEATLRVGHPNALTDTVEGGDPFEYPVEGRWHGDKEVRSR